ncbi:hypothetical protein BMS3Abin04_02092 [bacterium BMS3Abin04]|nr:hypothetical protein BMS3Abin04_02092 [bacterium BMS3Abin04]
MNEEVIYTAIAQAQKVSGIAAQWKQHGPLDGRLVFDLEGKEIVFTVKIKKELRQYHVHELLQLQQQYENLMVVAENIFPKIKETLRINRIAYLETNGNLFLKTKGIYYFIDTHKTIKNTKNKTNRAFTKAGLKVVFHFLLDKNLINKTQREIAKTTGVALGNIPLIINGIKETGYLLPLNNKEYVWENRKELLERWIDKYTTGLRPNLHKGNYTLKGDWNKIKLNRELTVWGGEPAADILTNYLRPEKLTLYTKENKLDLMKKYRLVPKNDGEIEVLEMFWENAKAEKTAPPLLVYADLILKGGKRNIETAQKIFNAYIEPNL